MYILMWFPPPDIFMTCAFLHCIFSCAFLHYIHGYLNTWLSIQTASHLWNSREMPPKMKENMLQRNCLWKFINSKSDEILGFKGGQEAFSLNSVAPASHFHFSLLIHTFAWPIKKILLHRNHKKGQKIAQKEETLTCKSLPPRPARGHGSTRVSRSLLWRSLVSPQPVRSSHWPAYVAGTRQDLAPFNLGWVQNKISQELLN